MGLPPGSASQIEAAIRSVENVYGVNLRDESFRREDREEIVHVLVHEACHAVILQAFPWIHDLPEREHTLVDEVAARFLEGEIARRLGLHRHSIDEHGEELSFYGFAVPPEALASLAEQWEGLSRDSDGVDRLVHATYGIRLAGRSDRSA